MDQRSPTEMLKPDELWPDSRKQLALKLFMDGLSMSAIATELKTTRGSIAGLLHRMKKSELLKTGIIRQRPTVQQFKPRAETRPKQIAKTSSTAKVIKEKIRLRLVDHNKEVTFSELQAHHCQWPLGDPLRSDFRFCGCQRFSTKPGKPYCEIHATIAGRQYEDNHSRSKEG